MKKFGLLLLTIMLIFSFAACSKNTAKSPDATLKNEIVSNTEKQPQTVSKAEQPQIPKTTEELPKTQGNSNNLNEQNSPEGKNIDELIKMNQESKAGRNTETYLLIGVDNAGELVTDKLYYATGQSDFIALLLVNNKDKSITVFHLDRDAMVDVPILGVTGDVIGTENEQLCLAHAYGDGGKLSCENVQHAVEGFIGEIEISGYISINYDAVGKITDSLGGIDVYIEDDLTPADKSFLKGSTVTLKGNKAVSFIRARMNVTDGTNASRMKRQKTFMDAAFGQFISKFKENASVVNDVYSAALPYLVSDMSMSQITNLAIKCADYRLNDFEYLPGHTERVLYTDGYHYTQFLIDYDALEKQLDRLFN